MIESDRIFFDEIVNTIPEKLKLNDIFPCRRCGICCKQSNASFLTEELEYICKNLKLDPKEFKEKYAITDKDNPHGIKISYPCPFFEEKENKCSIYSMRPMSCRLYPFASLVVTIKPCKKGLDIYNAIENWYKYKNEKNKNEKIDESELSKNVKLINDFYSRAQLNKISVDDKILTDGELEEILKNEDVKFHGITMMPKKDDLRKLIKFLHKKRNRENRPI